jgi:ABC-type antimicrobial peptide transport system permease subunit
MITNYLQLAWRNLMANKTVSFINIFGLSVAIAGCITVFLFLRNYWTLDNFHTNGDRIFIAEYRSETDGNAQTWADAPAVLATTLVNDFPQVARTVRHFREAALVRTEDNTFEELVSFADTGFLHMFSFPLQYGHINALNDPAAVVLSAKMAAKYFRTDNPMGRTVRLTMPGGEKKNLVVQGVAAPFPGNSDFNFNFLTAYPSQLSDDWGDHRGNVFVQLHRAADAPALATQMNRYLPVFNASNTEKQATTFLLDNLKNPLSGAYDTNRRPAEAPHPAYAGMLSAIALLLLALSCFNYINISLGAATRRLKEIGMRKVMGGNRTQLASQFMAENLLLCTLALAAGLVLCITVFAPLVNNIMVIQTESLLQNTGLWCFLIGLLAFTALVSGLYPAVYISAFRPTAIFSGKQKFGGKSPLRRGLLTIQFSLAFLAVITGVVLFASGRHWARMSWGYDPSQTMVVQLIDSTQYPLLKNELLKQPGITAVTAAVHHVGLNLDRAVFGDTDNPLEARRLDVSAGYFEALGLRLQSGRFFDPALPVQDALSVVVNETFVRKMGWSEAVGQLLRLDQKTYNVVGVAHDFKMFPTGVNTPTVFFCAPETRATYLVARHSPGGEKAATAGMLEHYKQLFDSPPIFHFSQVEVFDAFNHSYQGAAKTFGFIALLALFIACLGLYGLATQQFARRVKEVSVRKLLGAPVAHIVLLVNREFLVLLSVAGLIATTLGYTGMQLLFKSLEQYLGDYRPGLHFFLLANVLVFITAMFAIGQQSWKLARVALASSLKHEG